MYVITQNASQELNRLPFTERLNSSKIFNPKKKMTKRFNQNKKRYRIQNQKQKNDAKKPMRHLCTLSLSPLTPGTLFTAISISLSLKNQLPSISFRVICLLFYLLCTDHCHILIQY